MLNPRDVIERLCKLQAEVVSQQTGFAQPNDCFCGRGGFWHEGEWPDKDEHFRTSLEALEFIERAVRGAMALPALEELVQEWRAEAEALRLSLDGGVGLDDIYVDCADRLSAAMAPRDSEPAQ